MRRARLADGCYGAALLTLPLTGVGLVNWLFGVDLGSGLQPAYLLMALAWILRLADWPGLARYVQRPEMRRGLAWGAAVAAAVGLSAVGLRIAPAPVLAQDAWPRFLRQAMQLAVMAAFLAYPAIWTRGPRRWRWTLGLLAWATAGQLIYAGLLAVHQIVEMPGLATLDRAATSNPAILAGSEQLYLGGYTGWPRLRGSMSEPLYLGSYLLAVIPVLTLRWRLLPAAAAVVLLLTWSRGAWLAAAGGLVIWGVLRHHARLPRPSRRLILAGVGAVAAGALLAAAVAGPETLLLPLRRLAQTFDRGDWSNLTRYYSYQAAWRCFLESPLVGVGWGQFPYHFYALVDLPGLESQFTWPVVNSIPLLVLGETGLLGFGVFVAAVTMIWRRTWRTLPTIADPRRAARLSALAAGCGAVGLQMLIFSQYNLPHLWVMPGLWLAALAEEGARA